MSGFILGSDAQVFIAPVGTTDFVEITASVESVELTLDDGRRLEMRWRRPRMSRQQIVDLVGGVARAGGIGGAG